MPFAGLASAEAEPLRFGFYQDIFKTRILKSRSKCGRIVGHKSVENVDEAHESTRQAVDAHERATGLEHALDFTKQVVLESGRGHVVEHGKTVAFANVPTGIASGAGGSWKESSREGIIHPLGQGRRKEQGAPATAGVRKFRKEQEHFTPRREGAKEKMPVDRGINLAPVESQIAGLNKGLQNLPLRVLPHGGAR
jgi:hypothetical protein